MATRPAARIRTRWEVDRELAFLAAFIVIVPLAVDIVASYLGRDGSNAARAAAMLLAFFAANRSETNKLRRKG